MIEQPDELLIDRFANDLRARIEAGEFGTAGVLPSINELMERWKIKNRALVADVLVLLRVQGYIAPKNRRFRVIHPKIMLQGLTPNFIEHLQGLGFETEEIDIERPAIECLPASVARLFVRTADGKSAIGSGVHVIHRVRRQGIVDLPLRIGHIWYPLDIAEPYLQDMKQDSSFDMFAALKRDHEIVIAEEDSILFSRVPDMEEMKILNVSRYQPLLEVRRICYTENFERVIALHRTIMDGTRFEYRLSRSVAQ